MPLLSHDELSTGQTGTDLAMSRVVAVCLFLVFARAWVLKSGISRVGWEEVHINEDPQLPRVVRVRAITQPHSTV